MHPNPQFRSDDRQLFEMLIDQIGFGMVFAPTPDGPRVAHTPLLSTGDGAVQFHLARSNALSPHLEGTTALVTVNGPDAYVSPRWYADRDTVPTWDYLALEMEGRVRTLETEGLEAFLHAVIEKYEGRIEGEAWSADEASEPTWTRLFKGIVGFEIEVQSWRPTIKLSQKKSATERETIAAAQEARGNRALATLMRGLA